MNEEVKTTEPANRKDTGRNEDGTFKPGVSGNPSGRPKDTLKDYMRNKFMDMSSKEKEKFLKQIAPEVQWKMGEGNPRQDTDITSKGEKLEGFNFNTPYDCNDKPQSETGQGMEDTKG